MRKEYSSEKIQKIKDDIMKAAVELYYEHGYDYVNLLRISQLTDLSRPSIYNYYASKEEIFLDILLGKYALLGNELESLLKNKGLKTSDLARTIAEKLVEHRGILELISCQQLSIENGVSAVCLGKFKESRHEVFYKPFFEGLSIRYLNLGNKEKEELIMHFSSLVYGFYPLISNISDSERSIDFIAKTLSLCFR